MAIYHEDIVDIELESGTIHRSFMNHAIGTGDDDANRFGIRAFRNGVAETLGGTCAGYFIRADGGTVVIADGVVIGNMAYVTLPEACYAVEGNFTLAIKVSGSGVTGTMRIVDGVVSRTSTSATVDPGTLIPSIEDLLDAIEAAVESVPAEYDDVWTTFAPNFSSSTAYSKDQYVTYNGHLYRFTADHAAGSWDSSHVTAVNAGGELKKLNDGETETKKAIDVQKNSILINGRLYELDSAATFEQGNFTSTGDSESTTWIRTPKGNKIQNDFVIYNPYRLQYAVASFYGNQFVGYIEAGTDVVQGTIYRDQFAKVKRNTMYEYRLRVANYMASGNLTPAESTLLIFKKHETETNGIFRTPVSSLAVGNGAILNTGSIVSGDNYRYTDVIKLNAGETIHFEFAGPSNLVGLSKWTPSADGSSPTFSYDSALVSGDGLYHVSEYTAESDMYVRVSTMVYPVNSKAYTDADSLVADIFIFRAENYYDRSHPLYGKTITLMGDSLSYGSLCGNGAVWLQRLALKHNMTAYNMGINGNAVTKGYGTGTAMCERYTSIEESDYIVVEGGANDKGGGAPIGSFWSDPTNFVMNTDKTTFMGALNTIISGLHDLYPKAKLLFLTDYNRYPSKLHAYTDAMKEVCMMRSVPCFDDFASSGIAVCEDGLKEWQDEGLWLGGNANYHFTPEAYRDVLLPKYENLLENI